MTELERDKRRARAYRVAMGLVDQVLDEAERAGDTARAERLYNLLDTMKATECDMYQDAVYFDPTYTQPRADFEEAFAWNFETWHDSGGTYAQATDGNHIFLYEVDFDCITCYTDTAEGRDFMPTAMLWSYAGNDVPPALESLRDELREAATENR